MFLPAALQERGSLWCMDSSPGPSSLSRREVPTPSPTSNQATEAKRSSKNLNRKNTAARALFEEGSQP